MRTPTCTVHVPYQIYVHVLCRPALEVARPAPRVRARRRRAPRSWHARREDLHVPHVHDALMIHVCVAPVDHGGTGRGLQRRGGAEPLSIACAARRRG
eukprot:scaffold1800_cov387-Prasinococcus_capsulatus_cf.AAC.2